MVDFIINFAEVTKGNVTIKNHSTGVVIQIIVQRPREEGDVSLWLEYEELRQLMECVESIKVSR